MGLKCGIVGLPNVGKSTLFCALSNAKAEASNYEFCTIEPNIGVVNVPDKRLNILEGFVNPERVLPTVMEFVDIAGLVKGAHKGEGLGNKFLGNIREVDAIIHVVRCFENENVVRSGGAIDPVSDKEIIDTELQLKDLEGVDKRIQRVGRATKTGDKKAKAELQGLEEIKAHLEQGENLRTMELNEQHQEIIDDLQLLTVKPVIYLANVGEEDVKTGNSFVEVLKESVKNENAEVITLCASIEAEIAELDAPEDKEMFLEEYGLDDSGLDKLIRISYSLLDLITYFTAGVKEVRAWTITKGWKAPQAAGVIHTDFEKGFIKAEVITFADYQEYGSELACKEAGKLSIEGKEYLVGDGDVMHFRFNV